MVAYTPTLNDVAGLADSPVRYTTTAVGVEPVGLTDDATAIRTFGVVRTDDAGLSDAGRRSARAATGTEPVGLTDTISQAVTSAFTRQVNDSAGMTDAGQQRGRSATGVDLLDVLDASGPLRLDVAETVTDSAALHDTPFIDTTAATGRPARITIRVTSPRVRVRVTAP